MLEETRTPQVLLGIISEAVEDALSDNRIHFRKRIEPRNPSPDSNRTGNQDQLEIAEEEPDLIACVGGATGGAMFPFMKDRRRSSDLRCCCEPSPYPTYRGSMIMTSETM